MEQQEPQAAYGGDAPDFAALEAQAAQADQARGAEFAAPEVEPNQYALSEAQQIEGAIEMAAVILAGSLPKTSASLKVQAPAISQGLSAVFVKYGWSTQGLLDKWGPEITLIIATLPVALSVRADLADRKAANDAEHEAAA